MSSSPWWNPSRQRLLQQLDAVNMTSHGSEVTDRHTTSEARWETGDFPGGPMFKDVFKDVMTMVKVTYEMVQLRWLYSFYLRLS